MQTHLPHLLSETWHDAIGHIQGSVWRDIARIWARATRCEHHVAMVVVY